MPRINDLNSLKGQAAGSSGNSSDGELDDSDNRRQGFYVGGSDTSGQQVLGPEGSNNGEYIDRVLESARKSGAKEVDSSQLRSSQPAQRLVFGGSAHRLGGHGVETEHINQEPAPEDPNAPVHGYFNLWENGFSIDDGPLRDFNTPENRTIMASLAAGIVPPELFPQHRGKNVDVHMVRKMVPYEAPKKVLKPFQGSGYRLGAVDPAFGGSTSNNVEVIDLEPQAPPKLEENAENLGKAQEEVKLDASQPITRVQIRIPKYNKQIVGQFNHNHTILDLRAFIASAFPSLAFSPFQLATAYPSRPLEDEKETLATAQLLNSVVIVKLV